MNQAYSKEVQLPLASANGSKPNYLTGFSPI